MNTYLTEQDWIDIYIVIHELVYEQLIDNIVYINNPTLFENIIEYVLNIIVETIGDIYDDDDINKLLLEIRELTSQIISLEVKIITNIPDVHNTEFNIIDIKHKLNIINNTKQYPQKSLEWHTQRYNLLSASSIWKIFGSVAQRNSLIYDKCKPLNIDLINKFDNLSSSNPMHWGVKYEPVTVMLYETIYKTTVGEFGCIQHPVYSFIGASPDGINIDANNERFGRMIEIKNIVNREITNTPKQEYWMQIQIQLETCNLDLCDFVETRFKEYSETDFYQDNNHDYKGIILKFIDENNKYQYVYKPIYVNDHESWINEQIQKHNNLILENKYYWYLDEFSCIIVPRNKLWFNHAIPLIKETWDDIIKERITGYEHRSPKKRNKSCLIDVKKLT